MKHIVLILLIFNLSSCCLIRISHEYETTMLKLVLEEENGWRIIAPPPGVWESIYRRAYLPEYFPNKELLIDTQTHANIVYAMLDIGEPRYLALLINLRGTFNVLKTISGEGDCAIESFYSSGACLNNNTASVVISISPANAEFDNTAVFCVKGDRILPGQELEFNFQNMREGRPVPPARYVLASEAFLKEKQPNAVFMGNKTLSYAMLSFLFPMTCRDFEDAVFVIDGLYHKGSKLPPLKIRMNYIDLGVVPEYRGPGTANHVPAASQ